MEYGFFKLCRNKWAQIFLLIAFCLVFYLPALDWWELRKPDEIRYAQIANEIVDGGDWISMRLHGQPYWDKPPLFFWFVALSSYLWKGPSPFSARFPSAFFGTLTVLMVFFVGKVLYDSRTGLLSSLILATGFEFARFSTRANIDVTLTFFITASLFSFLQWYGWYKEGSAKPKDVRRLSIYGLYVSMALATLTKGPIGFILPLMPILVFLLVRNDWQGMRGICFLRGCGLFLAIVLAWFLPAAIKGGRAFLKETLFHQTIDYYSTGWDHAKPIYFYLINFPVDFLPWSLFLPGAVVYGYFRKRDHKREDFLFLFSWFTVIFCFFSLSAAKRNLYLLPLYPAASLLIAKFWGDFILDQMGSFRREWVSILYYGFVGFVLIVIVVVLWIVSKRFPSYLPLALPIMLFLIGGSTTALFLYRFRKYRMAFYLFIGIITVGFFFIENSLFLLDKQFKSIYFILKFIQGEFTLFFP